ncbi:MAG: membrane protein insertion efficiency factor YidD, partial [Bacteroidota bacterium]|nr:membrane protein insertion efficiency factor YidD [Bacteroidota bacterium]
MMKKSLPLFLFLLLFGVFCSFAQTKEDISLLREHNFENQDFKSREVTYGFGKKNSKSPVYHLLSSSMFVYQKCLTSIVSRSCAFVPSCSAYSQALIKEYGLLKGVICTTDRLMR